MSSNELDIRTLPTPIANAIVAFEAASNPHEQRDRLVEVFRATLRYLGGLALAVRLGHGPGPKGDSEDAQHLLDRLRRQSLTDGEWVGLTRELLRAWRSAPETHPLPTLVQVVVGRRTKIHTGLDQLLSMRKRETVAHGTTGTEQEARAIVTERFPQLVDLLNTLAPLFEEARVVVPLSQPNEPDVRQLAWLLHGPTTLHGEWRSLELAEGVRAVPKRPVMIDSQGNVRLELEPAVLCERASLEVPEDLFFFDGRRKRSAAFVAFPSIAEVWREDALERLGIAMSIADDAETATEPFLGLRSFGPEDAPLFVGRERLVEELTNRVSSNSWVTLVGASGSGKTSLLAAGVGPALRERVEREGYREEGNVYAIVMFRPGAEPQRALARELDGVGLVLDPEAPDTWPKRILDWCTQRRRVLVLMVDQAEELITQCKDPELREAFGKLLSELTTSINLPVRVVFSLRDDFMARLATIRSLGDRYLRATQVVTTPSYADLVRILTEPPSRFDARWEDGLAAEIASHVENEASAVALISYVGRQMWESRGESKKLSRTVYERLGGVNGAIAKHADAILSRMDASQQRTVREIFLLLITPERTRDIVAKEEIAKHLDGFGASNDDGAISALVDRLVEDRLLVTRKSIVTPGADAIDVIEIAHESLIEHWKQLRDWLGENPELHLHQKWLSSAVANWRDGDRPSHLLWGRELLSQHERVWPRAGRKLPDEEARFIKASKQALRRSAWAVLAIAVTLASGWLVAHHYHARLEPLEAEILREEAALLRGRHYHGVSEGTLRARAALTLGGRAPDQRDMATIGETTLRRSVPRIIRNRSPVLDAAFVPQEATVVGAFFDRHLRVFRTEDGNELSHVRLPAAARRIVPSPTGRVIAVATDSSTLLWRPQASQLKQLHARATPSSIHFSPSGDALVGISASDASVILWNEEGNIVWTSEERGGAREVRFLDEHLLAVLWSSDRLEILRVSDGHRVHLLEFETPVNALVALAGKLVLSHSDGCTVAITPRGTIEPMFCSSAGAVIADASRRDDDEAVVVMHTNNRTEFEVWNQRGSEWERTDVEVGSTDLNLRFIDARTVLVRDLAEESVRLWMLDSNGRSIRSHTEIDAHRQGLDHVTLFRDRSLGRSARMTAVDATVRDVPLILTAGTDGTIRVWSLDQASERWWSTDDAISSGSNLRLCRLFFVRDVSWEEESLERGLWANDASCEADADGSSFLISGVRVDADE